MGGAERSVSMLAEALVDAGHEVAACCISPNGWSREMRNGVHVFRMPHETDFWPEEWPNHTPLERGWRRFKQQFNYKLESHFSSVIKEFLPDIIHTHSLLDVSTRVWLAARAHNLPIVHTLRDFDLACGNAAMFKDGKRCASRHLKCHAFTFMKAIHQRQVTAVVGVGKGILESHLSLGYFSHVKPALRRVIWNPAVVEGIDAAYRKPSLHGRPFTFGYLGRINIEKGVGTLLDSCREMPAGNWQLRIAGKEASDANSLKAQASGLPVEFTGFIPPKELFDSIDVLIVPSIWAEPLPRTILEAYAAGVPVIGAASGGIPDLIGHQNADWLFPPGDHKALATLMIAKIKAGRDSLPSLSSFVSVLEQTEPRHVAAKYNALYDDTQRDFASLS